MLLKSVVYYIMIFFTKNNNKTFTFFYFILYGFGCVLNKIWTPMTISILPIIPTLSSTILLGSYTLTDSFFKHFVTNLHVCTIILFFSLYVYSIKNLVDLKLYCINFSNIVQKMIFSYIFSVVVLSEVLGRSYEIFYINELVESGKNIDKNNYNNFYY